MSEVFISYSKSDRTHALDLAGELRAHGFSVWIDQGSIGGAKNWATEIVQAIDACSTMLVLLSPESIISRNVAKELHLASEKRKNILPVMIERVALPANFEYSLAGVQHVYYHDRPAIFQALELLHGVVATESLQREPASLPKDDSIRIAVLPFDDLSPNHDNQWFADGMMDELISTLRSLERVKVPSRSDVLHYRNHPKQSREIAREVGVRYLIEGGVRKANEKIRINASLTDALRGELIWTNQFDGTFEDVFAFQESVAINITAALKLQLTPQEKQKVEEHGTGNAEAYELYLKGRQEQYYCTKESYLRALNLYEQAAALDPKFADAYISIASICCMYYREYSKNPAWLARAEEVLKTIKRISGETSRTVMIEGMIEWLRGNIDAATALLLRSGSLDSKNYNAFNLLGALYMEQRNFPAAAEAFEQVAELVEDTQAYFNLLNALSQFKDTNRMLAVAEKGLPVFDRYLVRDPNDLHAAISRCFVLLWARKKETATETAERIRERTDLDGHSLYNLGCFYSNVEQPDVFTSLVEKAVARGYRNPTGITELIEQMSDNPPLRSEFERILKNLLAAIQTENATV